MSHSRTSPIATLKPSCVHRCVMYSCPCPVGAVSEPPCRPASLPLTRAAAVQDRASVSQPELPPWLVHQWMANFSVVLDSAQQVRGAA